MSLDTLFMQDTYLLCQILPISPPARFCVGQNGDIFTKDRSDIYRMSSPHLVNDKKAAAPFSIGPHNCIEKPLRMMIFELRWHESSCATT
ncbi:uncharacterized protein ACLA_093120 [Aspergillus clavatus NRRL 1]|uniref:Uncharacterized protein n=1 Tax=Aspergillus clavatus (strain ATCC 1007 / CBS 513.65 / DSM 816 / NCTC 3887 / NRRL 1 / QM 1276 / 107) TaxID=344612 RepID=A1CFG4_ASPCL|nr:uncharacterized protein ACLA_093120 [Aspergillus clavatus NRRL 1]EAW11613.1 hypothetical protein ACLA_093120 [Aspergillus clavatus NRRL 1]